MTQAATMGPPLSPRETRRSGRRSAPSVSASASKSPDLDQPPRDRAPSSRVISSSTNGRSKKLKQEDYEESIDERKVTSGGSSATSSSNNGAVNNKAKRKAKEKEKNTVNGTSGDGDVASAKVNSQDPAEEEEEQGITRCVCGSTEDDPDAGEFMVQCETCKVWQHGLCMGYQSEDQVHDDDYYCELCRPELHIELLKKLAKKPRQSSANSRSDHGHAARVSRSHSPSYLLKQPSKRRNTMNSRDAAFDESLKEIIEATAAEAAAVQEPSANDGSAGQAETGDTSKKKRKRIDDEVNPKKRTRSASTASEGRNPVDAPTEPPTAEKPVSQAVKQSAGKNKRGGRKAAAVVEVAAAESEEVGTTTTKRNAHSSRSRGSAAAKRPPLLTTISHSSNAGGHDHAPRRNQSGSGQQGGVSAAEARAYRNSHAYAVSQQTLFTSWNLPDYLSHLEQMLPSHTPQPLEVKSGAINPTSNSRGGSVELTMERGVKVKWPAKRMSVGDMNKRVRALVEWVGREQASALDRGRRREALETALRENTKNPEEHGTGENADVPMIVDDAPDTSKSSSIKNLTSEGVVETSAQTMKMMEELMEELIGFQERFGPGAKRAERDRRQTSGQVTS